MLGATHPEIPALNNPDRFGLGASRAPPRRIRQSRTDFVATPRTERAAIPIGGHPSWLVRRPAVGAPPRRVVRHFHTRWPLRPHGPWSEDLVLSRRHRRPGV